PEQPQSFRHSFVHLPVCVRLARTHTLGAPPSGWLRSLKCGKSQPIGVSGKRGKSNLPQTLIGTTGTVRSCPPVRRSPVYGKAGSYGFRLLGFRLPAVGFRKISELESWQSE